MAFLFSLSAARRFHCESNLRRRGAYRELVPGYASWPAHAVADEVHVWGAILVFRRCHSLSISGSGKQTKVAFYCAFVLRYFIMSTSAYVGFPFALSLQSLFRRKISASIIVFVLLFVTAFTTLYFVYPETYNQMFTAKMSGENDSGQVRQDAGAAMKETMATLGPVNRIFGIGFGYYYGGVFYSVLVNTGLIGLLIYFYAFLKPVFCLRAEEGNIALKVGLGTLLFLFWVSVSELFLPTTWMFLGLAYWRLDQQKQTSRSDMQPGLGLRLKDVSPTWGKCDW